MLSSKNSIQYINPPFGPSLNSSITSSSEIKSQMSISHLYLKTSAAGSRLQTSICHDRISPNSYIDAQYVDLPLPAGPITI